MAKSTAVKTKTNELVITRVFSAPWEKVWKAWTEPELVKQWWGPKDFTTPVSQINLRVGGKLLYCMRSPEGKDYWGTGIYKELVPMERIVVTDSFADEHGNVVPGTVYGMSAGFPLEMVLKTTGSDIFLFFGNPDDCSEEFRILYDCFK